MKSMPFLFVLCLTFGLQATAQERKRDAQTEGRPAAEGQRDGQQNPERDARRDRGERGERGERGDGAESRAMRGRAQQDRRGDSSGDAAHREKMQAKLKEFVEQEKLTNGEARELFQLAFPARADGSNEMRRDQPRNARMRAVEVKDPSGFAELQDKPIFSGPQVGEALPAFEAVIALGDNAGEKIDPVAAADGKPQVLIFQDPSGVGLRGLVAFSRLLRTIKDKSPVDLDTTVVFVGDDPTSIVEMAGRLQPHSDNGVVMTYSPDGRDGPGSYGLNRNMAMTVLLAKDGQVIHNFVLPQGMLSPDPHVLGGVGQLIGIGAQELGEWLGAESSRGGMRREARRERD